MEVKIEKAKLLTTILANKKDHEEAYNQAKVVYKEKTISFLENQIEAVRQGKKSGRVFPIEPENHVDEYDTKIAMIEFDSREEITLTEVEFTQYVLDEWSWKGNWENTISQYGDFYKK